MIIFLRSRFHCKFKRYQFCGPDFCSNFFVGFPLICRKRVKEYNFEQNGVFKFSYFFFALSLLTLSSFLAFLLKLIHFAYADFVASNTIVRILVVGCFIYMKAWNNWSSQLVYFGYGTSIFICIYVYDCCCNLSEHYVNRVRGFYLGQVLFYVWTSIAALVGIFWL